MADERDLATAIKDTATATALDAGAQGIAETKQAAKGFGRLIRREAEQGQNVADETLQAGQKAAERGAQGLETLFPNAAFIGGFQAIWSEWADYGQASLSRWSGQSRSLLQVRSIPELISLQAEIARTELDYFRKSSLRVAELARTGGTGR